MQQPAGVVDRQPNRVSLALAALLYWPAAGAEATRVSVLKSSASGQLGKKQVVVFATHGLLAGDLPNLNQPALAMAASANPAESPLLTLEDVLSLKLNADWVVLSACNTASGEGAGAEAVSGLGRAFFYAGARALLVSNWPVDSEAARMLMTDMFKRQQATRGLNKAEYLQGSMLNMIDNLSSQDAKGKSKYAYAHPLFWAPFVVVGD